MTIPELRSRANAENAAAEVFRSGDRCIISVREESAFEGDEWLGLGTVCLPPHFRPTDAFDKDAELAGLVKQGAFEWHLPELEHVQDCLQSLLGMQENGNPFKVSGVLNDIASVGIRTGLLKPLFDPAALEEMPYSRLTTVVSDTCGVLQGGLDFIARYLHPAARVKIPAIVHMELVNSVDRFFKLRREKNKAFNRRVSELDEHLKSQGGQRALLRLELQADTEIERTFLLGDPLRSAFRTEKGELSDMNLAVPIKSYADRLILEAARHHQAQSGPTHEVRLLTSDQGLARMALAEGIRPLYFRATDAADFFGSRLTGRTFHPFTGEVQGTSLATVLWELATGFGSARLENENGKAAFTVSALGENKPWSPYHSLDDLLWCELRSASDESPAANPHKISANTKQESASSEDTPALRRTASTTKATFLRFDVGRLFRLVCVLEDKQLMNLEEIREVLGTKNRVTEEYRRFLLSSGLVSIAGQEWVAEPQLRKFSAALRNGRIEEIHQLLLSAPSYAAFATLIEGLQIGQPLEPRILKRGIPTYPILGEVTRICGNVQGKGIFPTPKIPSASEFAPVALKRYSELEEGEGLVATGAWLEALINKDGIHPEIARRRLDEASENGFLRRSTEGSTTQVRHDRHVLHVLQSRSGMPNIETVYLYRGDYLIPGKASVSLRIEGAAK